VGNSLKGHKNIKCITQIMLQAVKRSQNTTSCQAEGRKGIKKKSEIKHWSRNIHRIILTDY